MQVIFDSASDWLLVEGSDCETCKGDKYFYESSAFYSQFSGQTEGRNFGTILHLEGMKVTDQVCLVAGTACVNPYPFFLITDQYGLPSDTVDGILGLTQASPIIAGVEPSNEFTTEVTYMNQLYNEGLLTEVLFATHFSQWAYGSWIDFGEVRPDSMSTPFDLVTMKVQDGYFYSLYPLAIQFRNPVITATKRFTIPPKIAILSTALSYNLVPSSLQERFFEFLLAGIDYVQKDGIFYVDCTTTLSDVELMVEGCDPYPQGDDTHAVNVLDCDTEFDKNKKYFWLQFSAQDMIIDTKFEDTAEQLCIVNFLPNKDDLWVFGQGFYTDYYVVHEPSRGQLRIAPTDLRKKPKLR